MSDVAFLHLYGSAAEHLSAGKVAACHVFDSGTETWRSNTHQSSRYLLITQYVAVPIGCGAIGICPAIWTQHDGNGMNKCCSWQMLNLTWRRKRNTGMLMITISETPTEQKWVIHGRLTQPWLRELRDSWKEKHQLAGGRTCIVDLDGVTFIDKAGERTLRRLHRDGAQFIANGIYTKHIVEQLCARQKRGKSNLVKCFFAGFLPVVFALLASMPLAR